MGGGDAAKPNGQHNGGGCQVGASQAAGEGAPGSKMPPLPPPLASPSLIAGKIAANCSLFFGFNDRFTNWDPACKQREHLNQPEPMEKQGTGPKSKLKKGGIEIQKPSELIPIRSQPGRTL